ncbi:transcriptional regulator, BadM/Rrf2 family (plasmid) [Arthrobacter sp. FB24]|nr:transcriptional regulator, BadM/Rrf2 family [Arthrobacter sp. FB24]
MTSLLAPPLRSPAQFPAPFAREADMLLPLLTGIADGVLALRGEPFFEVQTLHGIADVVFADVDQEVMSARTRLGLSAVTEISEVATLMAFQSGKDQEAPQFLQTASLAARTGISPGHLRSKILPRLVERGWILSRGGGWALSASFIPPVRSMTAVEIKRTDWRRALSQANSYTDFSDAAYVAMDCARVRDTAAMSPAFNFSGVGLLTVRSDEGAKGVQRRINARRRRRRGLPHAVVAERIADLIKNESRSGEVGLVFGQFLTTTSGLDPRFRQCPEG